MGLLIGLSRGKFHFNLPGHERPLRVVCGSSERIGHTPETRKSSEQPECAFVGREGVQGGRSF